MLAQGIRETLDHAWEPMTSLLSKPRRFSLPVLLPDAWTSNWVPIEIERPAIIRMLVPQYQNPYVFGADTTSLSKCGIEAVPGEQPTDDIAQYQGLSNSGRALILPWGGRWFIQPTLNFSPLPTAGRITCIIWEAVPGITAADLLAIRGVGRRCWTSISITTADTVQHVLAPADSSRTYIRLQNTSGNEFRITFDDTDPALVVNGGVLLRVAGTLGCILEVEADATPLGPIKVAALTSAAATIAGVIGRG
jgi:hypothetical protein